MPVRIAIVTVSDTRTVETDSAGAALAQLAQAAGFEIVSHEVVVDEIDMIVEALGGADALAVDVIVTCGGTGLSPRDVTPEATRRFAPRDVPGIAEAIRAASLAITPRAMLSRAVAAQKGTTLVVNLPGSEKAARECWAVVEGQLEHAVSMMAGGGH